MQRLYMIYDDRSALCRWVKGWAKDQPMFVELIFLRAGSIEARRAAPGLEKQGENEELVAVGDEGQVYRGDAAWIMAFYALEEFREWSYRVAEPALRPLARSGFVMIARRRVNVLDWLGLTDREAVAVFGKAESPVMVPEAEATASGLQKIHQMFAEQAPRDKRMGR